MSTATSIQSPGLGPGTSLSLTGRPFGGRTILTLLGDVFKSPQFWDGIKVFGVGAAIAGSKWVAESIWDSLKRLVLARAVFRGGDDTHQWVMHYLTRTGHWSTHARDVEILCKPGLTSESIEEEEDGGASGKGTLQRGTRGGGGGGNAVVLGLPKGVNMFPLESTSLHFIFEGKHVFAVRDRKLVGDSQWEETLNLSFLTWSSAVIRRFIAVAKLSYDEHQRGKVQIFTTDRYNYWSRHKSITKRLSDSVHLPVNVKETLLRDATHFIDEDTKLWYSDRGIRYSRGYLFYGECATVHRTRDCSLLVTDRRMFSSLPLSQAYPARGRPVWHMYWPLNWNYPSTNAISTQMEWTTASIKSSCQPFHQV